MSFHSVVAEKAVIIILVFTFANLDFFLISFICFLYNNFPFIYYLTSQLCAGVQVSAWFTFPHSTATKKALSILVLTCATSFFTIISPPFTVSHRSCVQATTSALNSHFPTALQLRNRWLSFCTVIFLILIPFHQFSDTRILYISAAFSFFS